MAGQQNTPEMQEILSRMDIQDENIEHIKWLLKGSPALEIEGLIPSMKRVEKDVHEIKVWKNETLLMKGKIDLDKFFTRAAATLKFIAWVVGIGGGGFGVFKFLESVLAQ